MPFLLHFLAPVCRRGHRRTKQNKTDRLMHVVQRKVQKGTGIPFRWLTVQSKYNTTSHFTNETFPSTGRAGPYLANSHSGIPFRWMTVQSKYNTTSHFTNETFPSTGRA